MKKRVTVSIEDSIFKGLHLDSKNVSGYINELLNKELIGTYKEQLVTKISREIKEKLLADEVFMQEVSYRLKHTSGMNNSSRNDANSVTYSPMEASA